MQVVYMNSWGSLLLRAGALVIFGLVALQASILGWPGAVDAPMLLPAWITALLLALSAAHPLSIGLRLRRGTPVATAATAEGLLSLVFAAILPAAASSHAVATWVLPLALALAVLAIANGMLQHELMRREARAGDWPAIAAAMGLGAAGVIVLVAMRFDAQAAGQLALQATCAFALGAWIMHLALRLRRARSAAFRARLRDWTLGQPSVPTLARRLPAAASTPS